jgi:tetratricopeptide (TPR) repeat protein
MRCFILTCMLLFAAAGVHAQQADSTLLLADAYYSGAKYEMAFDACKSVSHVGSIPPENRHRYALACIKLHRYERARMLLESLTSDRRYQALAWFNLGVVYYNTGRYHLARNCFERASVLQPRWADTWQLLGYTALLAGYLDEAWEAFLYVSRLDADLAEE